VRVVGPNFVAGLIVDNDRVVYAAPILRRLLWQDADELREIFRRRGWKATIVRERRFFPRL
jgi:hypothetical protein